MLESRVGLGVVCRFLGPEKGNEGRAGGLEGSWDGLGICLFRACGFCRQSNMLLSSVNWLESGTIANRHRGCRQCDWMVDGLIRDCDVVREAGCLITRLSCAESCASL